jgi:hypothetical protein
VLAGARRLERQNEPPERISPLWGTAQEQNRSVRGRAVEALSDDNGAEYQ